MSRDKTRIRSIIKSMRKLGCSEQEIFCKYFSIRSNKPHQNSESREIINALIFRLSYLLED